MEPATSAELEHDLKKRRTRREAFLEKMDGLVPRERLEACIEPLHPKAGRGRRPHPPGVMLRMRCGQSLYDLSDPGMVRLLCEAESARRFAGLRLSGPLPDETTIPRVRHLLERHGLGEAPFEEIDAHPSALGHRSKRGTMVAASLAAAPSSAKNRKGERDPERHQTKKGNQWCFGADAQSGLTHRLETAPAHALRHGSEGRARSGAGCQGMGKREESRDWEAAAKAGRRRVLDKAGAREAAEKRKASVRAKAEHPFLHVKRAFGYAKARCRGPAKNTRRIALLPGFDNPLVAGRRAAA